MTSPKARALCECYCCTSNAPCPLATEIDRELDKARAAGRLEVAQAVGATSVARALAESGGKPETIEMLQLTLNALWRWTDDVY